MKAATKYKKDKAASVLARRQKILRCTINI